jgi:hypothetical protein
MDKYRDQQKQRRLMACGHEDYVLPHVPADASVGHACNLGRRRRQPILLVLETELGRSEQVS